MKNKIVVTTCIVNGYNTLFEPEAVPDGVDFVCFTDTPSKFKSKVWKIRKIAEPVITSNDEVDYVRTARKYKILLHNYLPEYDISIRIDGNMRWRGNNEAILKAINEHLNGYDIAISRHSQRDCMYKECKACIDMNKANPERLRMYMKHMRVVGFPENFGLVETGVIFRRHNTEKVVQLQRDWFRRVMEWPPRDQLHIMPALRSTGTACNILQMHVRKNPYVLFDAKSHRLKPEKK